MKTITFNDDNLSLLDVTRTTTKARAIILDKKAQLYLSHYAGCYLLPGGEVR